MSISNKTDRKYSNLVPLSHQRKPTTILSQSKRFHICRTYFHVTEPLLTLLTWQDKQDLISFVIVLCVKRRENKLYFDYLLTRKHDKPLITCFNKESVWPLSCYIYLFACIPLDKNTYHRAINWLFLGLLSC